MTPKAAVVSEVLSALMDASRKKRAKGVLMPKPSAEEESPEVSDDEMAMLVAVEPEDEEDDEEEM